MAASSSIAEILSALWRSCEGHAELNLLLADGKDNSLWFSVPDELLALRSQIEQLNPGWSARIRPGIAVDEGGQPQFLPALTVEFDLKHTPREKAVEALKGFLDKVRVESPDARQTIHRAMVDGDMVAVHVHVERFPGDPGLAVVDIFRVANGMIAEHWDVLQEVPANPVNPLPMF